MCGRILVLTALLLASGALGALEAQTVAVQFAVHAQTGISDEDSEMASARKWIQEFCTRMSSDYGIKVTFADFAENGTRDQILKFAAEVAKNSQNLDAFCQRMARKMSPFSQGKGKRPQPGATGERGRRTGGASGRR
jgi:hypothetical protein